MSDDQKPKPGTPEYEEWYKAWLDKRMSDMFSNGPADFDERGVLSGSDASVNSTDAEAFPDEPDEYQPEERKPRLVHSKKD